MQKKYELMLDTQAQGSCVLHRIRALRDFGDVKAGDLGGFVESEANLSHEGDCWISEEARVFENAQVSDNGWISGNAWVYGKAQIYGNADVRGDAQVFGNAKVCGDAMISSSVLRSIT